MTHVEEMMVAEINAESLGVPRSQLMEMAGSAVADAVMSMKRRGASILVVCGPGNNGGDGLVAAKKLLQRGYGVSVLLMVPPDSLKSQEARSNWQEYERVRGVHFTAKDEGWLDRLNSEVSHSNLVVDAMFGTGIEGEITGAAAEVIDAINSSRKQVVSVDTPSGLDPFTGRVVGRAVKANLTVTFHAPKRGLILRPKLTGRVVVADIGIPESASAFVTNEEVRASLLPRARFTHKGDYGSVLVVGGSELYSGAPALAGLAALRAGAGLVLVASPEQVVPSIRGLSPDLIVRALPGERIRPGHLELMRSEFDKANVLAIGPGLGRAEDSLSGALEMAKQALTDGKRVVVDADALDVMNRLARESSSDSVVVTPHAGEFKRLTGVETGVQWRERVKPVRDYAGSHNCTLLLKGHHTVVSDGKRVKVHIGGNPGMAKGGMGDVLTGVVSGMMAQGSGTFEAACGAAHVCGEAADRLFASKGFHYLASDMLNALPEVLRGYDRYSE